ncbi:ABC transporter substrate-binding protein [Desulfobacter hydrogenophilus]|uniref:ABC transporter substrate-binding protein n=1 Tax=Desulfobacter hydrogenophilus TaxID=2291 RepID=A0A328FGS5_9BACT|nr:zinc ABC transporter substrate-binding protein [Desulfobacter hydrogenophilus]NDY73447.1 zinc ABC transporter solute-binding protein [Desulfobacter hydrogenophilus]QBH14427.1 ABC transporter substrate-binding protein [Desulfobacter hydrogenophilus]RAM02247.1 ABC transporter substrate-binding protein [Desulfobacter hydrogenophilus]
MKFLFKKLPLFRSFLIFSSILLFSGLAGAAQLKKPVIVSSTTQIADFARQVVGDQAVVKSILAPGADPHTYNVTPDDVQIVLGADLCIENGLHLEGKNWMATLAQDAQKPLITATDGIQVLTISEGGQSLPDPHSWFSLKNAVVYVNNITRAIIALDPEHGAYYQARAKLFLQQLRVLDAWIREQLNMIPPQRRILVTTHDAFNYFCREYRLNENNDFLSIAPVGWSTGAEVGAGITPERRRKVIDSIRDSGAPAIFVETTINPKQIREIAKETGVKIGGELYSDSMGPEDSAGETYIGMMRENTLLIVNALK